MIIAILADLFLVFSKCMIIEFVMLLISNMKDELDDHDSLVDSASDS